MEGKICPLLTMMSEYEEPCMGEKCAWYEKCFPLTQLQYDWQPCTTPEPHVPPPDGWAIGQPYVPLDWRLQPWLWQGTNAGAAS